MLGNWIRRGGAMRIIQHCYVSTIMMVMLLSAAQPVLAERPGTVDVKASEKAGAGVVERVKLYSSSYALVIGNDKYQHWPKLEEAERDAREVAAELKNHGFEVDLQFNLDAAALSKQLKAFFAKKGQNPESRLLLWFAGHGHTLDDEGYLVPVDAVANGSSPDFLTTALPMRDFGSLVRLAKSKHVLSVFDSCFSGTIFRTRAGSIPNAITRKTLMPVRQFITSGDAGQQVRDDGSFRTLFLRALRGQAGADFNKDGYLTGEELGLFLNQEMSRLTGDAQTPNAGKLQDVKYDEGDFVFFLPQDGSPVVEAAIPSAPQRSRGSLDTLKQRQNERSEWKLWQQSMQQAYDSTLKETKSFDDDLKLEAWNQFLANYPDDNPLSHEDESLRQQAKQQQSQLQKPATKLTFTEVSTLLAARAKQNAPVAGEERTIDGMKFVWIPPGSFDMGSNDNDREKPVHQVNIRQGFWMGKYEVTQAQWKVVMGSNPSGFKGDDRPVEKVSWEDVQSYLKKSGSAYRLPSEAEWEYAARGGTTTTYSWGNVIGTNRANCDGCGSQWDNKQTAPVGSFSANDFGLYDMHGNVREWTSDCWNGNYTGATSDGSAWLTGICESRVLRGGSWFDLPSNLRSAYRFGYYTGLRYYNIGFRVVLSASAVQD